MTFLGVGSYFVQCDIDEYPEIAIALRAYSGLTIFVPSRKGQRPQRYWTYPDMKDFTEEEMEFFREIIRAAGGKI